MKTSNHKSILLGAWRLFGVFSAVTTLLVTATSSWGQTRNSYTKTNIVSDVAGRAEFTDPNLVNAWGLSLGNEFWVSDNGTGLSTLYDLDGTPLSLVVTIPPSASNTEGVSAPTGNVFNS